MTLYGLFRQDGKRYTQVVPQVYSKPVAVRVFQDRLIYEGLCLRPVKATIATPSPLPVTCKPCADHLHTACKSGACDCNCRMFDRVPA